MTLIHWLLVQCYKLELGIWDTYNSYDTQLYSDTYWHLVHLSHTPVVICSCTVTLNGTWHVCHTHVWYAAAQWYLLALGTFVTHTRCDMQLYSDTYWHLAHLSHTPAVICSSTVTPIGTWHICHTHQVWYAAVQWYLLALDTFVTHTSCDMQLHRFHMPLQMHSLTHPCSQQAHCNGCWTYRVCQLLEFVTSVT